MKYVLLLTLVLVGGCFDIRYNDLEYIRLIDIRVLAQKISKQCGNMDDKLITDLKDKILFEKMYAQSRRGRDDVRETTRILQQIVEPISVNNSKEYCIQKMSNVDDALESILEIEAYRN